MKPRMPSSDKRAVCLTIFTLLIWAVPLQADRILVIGDSWAKPVAPELQLVLHENGHTDMFVDAAPFRYTTAQMASPTGLAEITAWLDERPDVTVVQMSTGANDWEESGWSALWAGKAEEANLFAGIVNHVETIVDHIFSVRPGIRVLWSSYDFPRPLAKETPFFINSFLTRLAEQMSQFADHKPGVSFVDMNGTLQVKYGFDGVQHTPYDPDHVIPPGDPSLPHLYFPSPLEPFLPNDAWHLKSEGYKALAQVQFEGFYASLLAGKDFYINAGLNDAWYNPATNGQGFLITVFPESRQMFLAWFTFDTERPPGDVTAMLGEPGQRWLTAQGPYDGDTANLTIFVTEGGVFDAVTPAASTDPAGDGNLTIEFADCTEGMVTYSITSLGITGEIPIQRISTGNVPLCESLNAPLQTQ